MEYHFTPENTYNNISFQELAKFDKDIENCKFTNCDFSYADLSNFRMVNSLFENCNISLAKMRNSSLQKAAFYGCKLTGINFSDCSSFSFITAFSNCIMDYTIWHRQKMKGTHFSNCVLTEADFSETDLTNAVFENCNLPGAIFSRTILKGADFTTAQNFSIDPENNTITKARFSAGSLSNLLTKYNLVIE